MTRIMRITMAAALLALPAAANPLLYESWIAKAS